MTKAFNLRAGLAAGVAIEVLLSAAPALAQPAAGPAPQVVPETKLGELVVTAQRRNESLQNVPIAVSAFSGDTLKKERLEGGQDLLLEVPNVTFSRGNYGGYNFQIRGIGAKLVATSADAAIGVHENNVPLAANTLADAEFYDVRRVEVLRGPQGTQFGRNTTGGLVNLITNVPTDRYEGSVTGEYGNYNSERLNGFVNLPMGEGFTLRAAGAYLKRDGFGKNDTNSDSIDGRDLYSTRLTLAWKPNDRFYASMMWEHFKEDDNRDRVGKQLCISDPGLTSIGGVPTGADQNVYSQGCKAGDLHGPNALGEVNSAATLGGGFGNLTGLITGNAYAGKVQDPNLRNIESAFDPIYKHDNDLYVLNLSWRLRDDLELTSTTAYTTDNFFSEADYNRATPTSNFNANVPNICATLGCPDLYTITDANGVLDDPQVGALNHFATIDFGDAYSNQRSQEFRLQSIFPGALNFSAGLSYLKFKTLTDYYVTSNTLTAATEGIFNALAGCPATGSLNAPCEYVDPNSPPTGIGHNYFDSRTRYQLTSYAGFGEVYYNFTPALKLTAGIRYTDDRKRVEAYAPPLFVAGSGVGTLLQGVQTVAFKEVTGRINLDWTPTVPFTDKSLFYASYARGYKGGGFNPPQTPGQELFPETYAPEFIDAFEIGSKNTLLNGHLILNGDVFYYLYNGYQVSEIIQRTSVNVNVNAKIYGVEGEALWEPVHNLQFNANIGYLHTALDPTSSIDLMDLTQGHSDYQVVKNGLTYSDCVAPVAQLAALQSKINGSPLPLASTVIAGNSGLEGVYPGAVGVCNGGFATGSPGAAFWGAAVDPVNPGFPAQLGGKELPNSPHWTVSLGGQYKWLLGDWTATPRVDFYYQAASFARIFNAANDRLDSYSNTNLSVIFEQHDWGLNVQIYVKNVFDKTVVTDQYLTDDTSGLFTNIFLTDPRTYGVSVTKTF